MNEIVVFIILVNVLNMQRLTSNSDLSDWRGPRVPHLRGVHGRDHDKERVERHQ